eukprot:6172764-Pleurochrysis_carterae.AAC.1
MLEGRERAYCLVAEQACRCTVARRPVRLQAALRRRAVQARIIALYKAGARVRKRAGVHGVHVVLECCR